MSHPVSPPPNPHAPQRYIIAADADLEAQIDRLLDGRGEAVRVPGFLAAVGEASRQQAEAVIGPLHAVADMLGSTAEAVRRLSPRTRLLVTCPAGDAAASEEALAAGFDAVLHDPPEDYELARALGLSHSISGPEPGDQPEPDATIGLDATLENPMPDPAEADYPEPLVDTVPPNAAPDDHLGDTDLVEAVLRGQGELDRMALRLASHRSGIEGLALAKPNEPVPGGRVSVDVRLYQLLLGRLHAPTEPENASDQDAPLTAEQLLPWADWLARWLSLDRQFTRLRDLSLRDELTGVYNRRYFNRFLNRVVQRAAEDRQQVTVMVFDIDNFKKYNDVYGHPAGDEILVEIARLMRTNCRDHDVVARIGGDEFAVIFWDAGEPRRPNSKHPQDVLKAAKRFQQAVCDHNFPKLTEEAAGSLTISAGLAGFPWDGRTPEELLDYADQMALRSKQQGKNAITFGPNTQFVEEEEC